jgi:serine phosphatase RsbU (regulator of sigma subunit)
VKRLFTILFCLLQLSFFAQSNRTDSLIKVLKNCKVDTAKVKLLNVIGWDVSYVDLDSGLSYAKESYDLAKKIHYSYENASICNTIGSIYSDQGKLDDALKYYYEGLTYCETYKLYFDEGNLYNSIAIIFQRKKEFRKAISNYYKAIKAYQLEEKGQVAEYTMYSNIGGVYEGMEMHDSALYFVNKAYEFNLKNNKKKKLVYNYATLSEIYFALKDYKHAEEFSQKCISIAREFNDRFILSQILTSLGNQQLVLKKYKEALLSLNEAIDIAKESGELEVLSEAHKTMSDVYKEMGDYKKALDYRLIYQAYKDSMFNKDNNHHLQELETKYETEKKQKEIIGLNEKNKTQQLESEKNKVLLYSAIGGGLALLVIALILYNRNALKQKTNAKLELVNKEIHLQKELVEEKNKEITDSINYALRIQQSILTSDNYFKKHTNDVFILFKPKDIVSGDFYWALHHEDKFIVMTADCTGHGVPGAMMSMMGVNFLNEIVTEKHISGPADILNQLRKDIIKALNPEDSTVETKDGLDCCLCSFDFHHMKLSYANANNNFYIIRDKELITSQSNKMPVGAGHNSMELFKEWQIDLQKNDIVITLTDGYADQFKYKQLETTLLESAHLPLSEIKNVLDVAIDSWKGNLEQVDDICIIGLKI